jgi:hypothetical protein
LVNKHFENNLYEFIEYQLPLFDEILANNQEPLSQRPLAAAIYFVNFCVVDVKGDNKENFLEKKWFRSIYKLIKKWYTEQYAEAMNHVRDNFALGVVLIYKTPFLLNIPLSIAEEKESNDKKWFCLPNSILEKENVFEWIQNKPNFSNMPNEYIESLKKEVYGIASSTREINVNLMSASLDKELHKISGSIHAHIEKAVRDITSLKVARISTSFWEIHLAIEKAIKLIILQNGHDHKSSHNLCKLCKIANNIKGVNIDCDILSKFPSDNEAIKQRYGEGKSFTIQEAVNNYINANRTIAKLTELLKRKLIMNNARFLIAIPPWEK